MNTNALTPEDKRKTNEIRTMLINISSWLAPNGKFDTNLDVYRYMGVADAYLTAIPYLIGLVERLAAEKDAAAKDCEELMAQIYGMGTCWACMHQGKDKCHGVAQDGRCHSAEWRGLQEG